MKRLLVRWLLRLTDIPKAPPPGSKTEDFLLLAWMHEGFRSYAYAREEKLKDYLANPVSDAPLARDKHILAIGQLQELTVLVQYAKKAYEAKSQK